MGQGLWRLLKRSVLYGSLLSAAAFLLLSVLMALKVPSDSFWSTARPDWVTALFIVVAVGSSTLPFEVIYLRAQLVDRRTRLRLSAYARLMFIEAMERRPSLALTLSVHVWRTKRHLLTGTIQMERIITFRLVERPYSEVQWFEGKGVIGKCWKLRQALLVDLRPLHATVAEGGETAFRSLSPQDRFGLGWDDYRMTKDYTAIYASPLLSHKGKVIGCVTVDCTTLTAYAHLGRMLHNVSITESVIAMSRTLEIGESL
jgi:hypothetical protein